MRKKLLSLIMALVLVIALIPTAAAASGGGFADVKADDWFYDDVAYVVEHNLMIGTSATAFSPDSTLTRAMILTVLARASGVDTSAGAAWYSAAADWATAAGISDGTSLTTEIGREQIAAMLYRYAGIGSDGWGGPAMKWAEDAGIMTNERGTESLTRAEAAAVFHRFFTRFSIRDGEAVYTFYNDGVAKVTDPALDYYFEGAAREGIEALLNAGQVYVNNKAVPATESETESFVINGFPSLWKTENGWAYSVHKLYSAEDLSFEDARIGFLEGISRMRGLTVELYSTGGRTHTDRIEVLIKESTLVNTLTVNGADTRITRYDFALATDELRPDVNEVVFPTKNVDPDLKAGDIALYWYDGAEWHIQRAVAETGTLVRGEGEAHFVLNGAAHMDALITRYNLQAANRTSQFLSAHEAFGLEGIELTMWSTETGYPIGFTRGGNARAALELAIQSAKAYKEDIQISTNGSEVSMGDHWVTAEAMADYDAVITAAQAVLNNNGSTAVDMDMAIYDMYAALGSAGGRRPSGLLGAMKRGTAERSVIDAVDEYGIADSEYDDLFNGNARQGVADLIAAGAVKVNGMDLPAPTDTVFHINGGPALWKEDDGTWSWKTHVLSEGSHESYDEAIVNFVNSITTLRGSAFVLNSKDGVVTGLETTTYDVIMANTVTHDGQYVTITTLQQNGGASGKPNPGTLRFPVANVEGNPQSQDVVLYWEANDGWHLKRAASKQVFVDVTDTGSGKFAGTVDGAPILDSRLTLNYSPEWSRPSQPIRGMGWMGETHVEVFQWFSTEGITVGFSRVDAKGDLSDGIAKAENALNTVQVSAAGDGSDVAAGQMWVTQEYHAIFSKAIEDAKAVLNKAGATNNEYEGALYALAQAYGGAAGDRFSWLNNPYFGRADDGSYDTGYNGTGFWTAAQANITPEALASIQENGTDAITSAAFDKYFKGTAAEGVEEILNAGKFYVNGFALPATEGEFNINLGFITLVKTDGGWSSSVHKGDTSAPTFEEARLELAEGLTKFAGLYVNLFDDDNDGYADRIETTVKQSVRVDEILVNGNTVKIDRTNFQVAKKEGAGEINDVTFSLANVDPNLHAGDIGLYWEEPDGFHIDRCASRTGRLTEGTDHGYYVFDGVRYEDIGGVTKYHLATANRPGRFLEAQRTLGLLGQVDVIAWTVGDYQLAAFSNTDAAAVLRQGIAAAKTAAGSAVGASADALAALETQIAAAETALADGSSTNADLDRAFYLLARAVDALTAE